MCERRRWADRAARKQVQASTQGDVGRGGWPRDGRVRGCHAVAMSLDHLAHLRADSARFAAVLRETPADRPVPSCPAWQADDLLWHLGKVQSFWATIVRDALDDPSTVQPSERPTDRQGLVTFFAEASDELQRVLAGVDPSAPCWTWSEDQTAGFVRRRQAHEALIHRIDAELTADVEHAPIDRLLASDGVDEALRIMFGGAPPWARLELDGDATLRVASTDDDRSWWITLGRFDGTSPETGTTYDDEPAIDVAATDPGTPAAATLHGTSADLDRWLWNRPVDGEVRLDGDPAVAAAFRGLIATGID
jgi:uncharacterized protein (TIGR03083 family)